MYVTLGVTIRMQIDFFQERDAFLNKQKQLENELTVINGRLEASNHERLLEHKKLEEHMTHCGGLNRERKLHESVARSAEVQLTSLQETLARMLSDDFVKVEPSEDRIRERVAELMHAVKEKTLVRIFWLIRWQTFPTITCRHFLRHYVNVIKCIFRDM